MKNQIMNEIFIDNKRNSTNWWKYKSISSTNELFVIKEMKWNDYKINYVFFKVFQFIFILFLFSLSKNSSVFQIIFI